MKSVFFSFCLAFAGLSAASELPEACASALRRALSSGAGWTMERRLAGSDRSLFSTGIVVCTPEREIVWKAVYPFPSSVSMTTNAMIFADEDGRRVKPLDRLPYYDEIRRRTDAFARGDTEAFDGLFELEARNSPNGGWTLVFSPEVKAMRSLISEVELTGSETLEKALLRTSDGGCSVIRFKESERGRQR